MRVFLTGSTGFIGSRIIPELVQAGHSVIGLTRSETGAKFLKAAGAEVHHGNLEDLDSLRTGAAKADGVIHCGFNHDFSRFIENCQNDGLVIDALASALEGTNRPLVITSTTTMGTATPGEPAIESYFNANNPNPRVATELAGRALLKRGVNVSFVRLSQIHDTEKHGFVTEVIRIAREKGVSAYIAEGSNRWSAAHVNDTACLYRLALEKSEAGGCYHATAEEGITFKQIAEAIGKAIGIPVVSMAQESAAEHFGWLAAFAAKDMSASSKITKQKLGWNPNGNGLIEDIERMKSIIAH